MGSDNTVNKIVLFDGVCNLCSASVQFIIRHNIKEDIKFASLQSEYGQGLLASYQLSPEVRTIVFIKDGKAFLRSEAALEVCRDLNGLYPYLRIFKIVPVFLRDWVYNLIARNRYQWFGKKDQCWIPTPDLASRFIR